MTNKNYQSGRNFEYRVKKYLEDKGYYVMRSAGSKSPFDLIAVPTWDGVILLPDVLLIQCKHGAKIGKAERDRIKEKQEHITAKVTCIVAWSPVGKPIEFYYWHKFMYKNQSKWEIIQWLK